jgi:hypothetical protein
MKENVEKICEKFAEKEEILTCFKEFSQTRDDFFKNIKNKYSLEWYGIYTEKEQDITCSVEMKAELEESTGKKKIKFSYTTSLPTYTILSKLKLLMSELESYMTDVLKKEDKNRVKRITEGKDPEEECKITYEQEIKTIEKQNEPWELFGNTLEQISKVIVKAKEDSSFGNKKELSLLLYGERGKQIAEALTKRKLTTYKQTNENTYSLQFLFPFQQNEERKELLKYVNNKLNVDQLIQNGLFVIKRHDEDE